MHVLSLFLMFLLNLFNFFFIKSMKIFSIDFILFTAIFIQNNSQVLSCNWFFFGVTSDFIHAIINDSVVCWTVWSKFSPFETINFNISLNDHGAQVSINPNKVLLIPEWPLHLYAKQNDEHQEMRAPLIVRLCAMFSIRCHHFDKFFANKMGSQTHLHWSSQNDWTAMV